MKNISYKIKNRYLLIANLLFLFIAYFYSIKNTISQFSEYRRKSQEINRSITLNYESFKLKEKIRKYDNLIGSNKADTNDHQQILLQTLTTYCYENNIVLKDFPNKIISTEKEYIIETNCFKVSAPFNKLLDLLYLLEQGEGIGKVSAVNFMLSKNLIERKEELLASIYVQTFNRKENEN